MGDRLDPLATLLGIGQLAMDQEIGHLEKAAFIGQLLDGITPGAENATLAIYIGDGTATAGRVEEGGIVAHHSGAGPVCRDLVELGGRDRTMPNGNLLAAAASEMGDDKCQVWYWLSLILLL